MTRGSFFSNVTSDTETSTFPYTTLFRSLEARQQAVAASTENLSPLVEATNELAAFYWLHGNYTKAVKRSEEHTSELQSRENLVCRLLLEKKKICKPIRLPRYSDTCVACG